jgi:hypothetical protein
LTGILGPDLSPAGSLFPARRCFAVKTQGAQYFFQRILFLVAFDFLQKEGDEEEIIFLVLGS